MISGVLNNVDVLLKIFKYLQFDDQLSAALVNDNFNYIITRFIWKLDFSSVLIRTNEYQPRKSRLYEIISEYFIYLPFGHLQNFLTGVKKMTIDGLAVNVVSNLKFNYLQDLHLNNIYLNIKKAKCIVNNCPNVTRLKVQQMKNYNNKMFLKIIDVAFCKWKLKSFDLKETTTIVHSSIFVLLLKRIHTLTDITFNSTCIYDWTKSLSSNGLKLKKLKMKHFQDSIDWCNFSSNYLYKFLNLTNLKLSSDKILITDSDFSTIATHLRKLEHLKFKHCNFNVKHFPDNFSLQTLKFINCQNLNLSNLNELLIKNIVKQKILLSSMQSNADENIETVKHKSNLKELNISMDDIMPLQRLAMGVQLINLKTLYISSGNNFEGDCNFIARLCPHLEHLKLGCNLKISPEYFPKTLKTLNVGDKNSSADFYRYTLQLPQIKYISTQNYTSLYYKDNWMDKSEFNKKNYDYFTLIIDVFEISNNGDCCNLIIDALLRRDAFKITINGFIPKFNMKFIFALLNNATFPRDRSLKIGSRFYSKYYFFLKKLHVYMYKY